MGRVRRSDRLRELDREEAHSADPIAPHPLMSHEEAPQPAGIPRYCALKSAQPSQQAEPAWTGLVDHHAR